LSGSLGIRQSALLALLALDAGHVVTVQRILDEIWGDDLPSDPANAVQARVSSLRKVLGPGVLVAQGGGYRLDLGQDDLDIVRFERAVTRGRELLAGGDATGAAHEFRAALDLWRGLPLYGLGDLEFARNEATRLEELHLKTIEDSAEAEIRLGRHAELVPRLKELTRIHPLYEGFAAQLMLALYRSGRQIEALQVYREISVRLLEEFGLEPGPRLRDLESAILTQEPDLLATARREPAAPVRPLGNLPAVANSFIGRQDELARVRRFLAPGRALTLTGPGGSGKTRLALEAAQAELATTPDGVWLVELAPLATPLGIAAAALRALGVSESSSASGSTGPEDRLVDYLWGRHLLLVVDNCEHLIADVAALVELILARAPTVKVLATSREAFDIPGETRMPVEPMEVPPSRVRGHDSIEEYDAVRLFVDRARAVNPDFSVNASSASGIAEICRRLEGLPLALELAASQVRVLSVPQIAASLGARFDHLASGSRRTVPRHRTLQAAINWSYERLDANEQVLFASLSVFAGGFDLEAGQHVGGSVAIPPDETTGLLGRLIDKSLVLANTGSEVARYRLLEPLRLYAASWLEQRGTRDAVRSEHALWYLVYAESAESELHSARQGQAVIALERELDNLYAAFDWLVEQNDAARAQRMATALAWFYWMRGNEREGWLRLETALALDEGDPPTVERARALMSACNLGQFAHELEMAFKSGHESLMAFTNLGLNHSTDAVLCRVYLVGVLFRLKRFEEGDAELAQALTDAAPADHWAQAACGRSAGLGALWRGRPEDAERWFTDSLAHVRACGDLWAEHRILFRLASIAERRGAYAEAIRLCDESLSIARRVGFDDGAASRLAQLGRLTFLSGDPVGAEPLLCDALETALRLGANDAVAEARSALGFLEAGRGNYHAAQTLQVQALDLFHRAASHMEAVEALVCLGLAAYRLGDIQRSYATNRQALVEAIECSDGAAEALAMEGYALTLAANGDAALAAVMLGSAHTTRLTTGIPAPPFAADMNEQTRANIVHAVGLSEADARFEKGMQLEPAQVFDLLMQSKPVLQ
jgi:predicted ATPase/DNA-binding SARP family transcriptional activator